MVKEAVYDAKLRSMGRSGGPASTPVARVIAVAFLKGIGSYGARSGSNLQPNSGQFPNSTQFPTANIPLLPPYG